MKRITIIGLAALCALALAAVIGASGASAAETTAYTCVTGTGAGFKDADCTEAVASGASFVHKEIAAGTKTDVELDSLVNPKLTSTIAGAAVTLEATSVECDKDVGAPTCYIENKGSAGAMEVFGEGGRLSFTGVTVVGKASSCRVKSSSGVAGVVTTNPLKVQTIGTNEVLLSPVTPTALASFTIEAIAPEKCAFAGPYTVSGDVNGTTNGSNLTINVTQAQKTLSLGVNPAGLTGKATVTAGPSGGPFNPVALT